MTDTMSELDELRDRLRSSMRPKKPKMLVVDDEPDNLDLLYRTFRREFRVYKAESGIEALDILEKEGEVAVIVSDQRMPEMKGTEFLSKTVTQFPNTVRIILTGFTDIEDLVEAINSGQVYKYITKPWDPNELRGVVKRAADTYELLKLKTEELEWSHAQMAVLGTLMQVAETSEDAASCLETIARALGENFSAEACVLQLVENGGLVDGYASHGNADALSLAGDLLVEKAIATGKIQGSANVSADPDLSGLDSYQSSGVQAHLVLPIAFRGQLRAVASLQWTQPNSVQEKEVEWIHRCAQQIALALTCADLA
ncbi:Hydrogenase transcriptional regulatory protein hoxA [Geitlerinema sp. FC II]|nr:response regulator [Geitlerinema sp. CS-897]PPT06195.1 Hydrogenase transcriptional regulatory protein hoxA [Geitlerinema sp. FC II]